MHRAAIRRAIALAHTAPPDLVVVSGAVIPSARDPFEEGVAALIRLRVLWGLWGGDHGHYERWVGGEARAPALVARHGMPLRRQPCAARSGRGGAFTRIGVDDQRARPGEPSARRRGLEARVRRDSPHLWRSHHPETFPQTAALGIELSLVGHTHGGQLRFALGDRQCSPASLVTPFVVGLYRLP